MKQKVEIFRDDQNDDDIKFVTYVIDINFPFNRSLKWIVNKINRTKNDRHKLFGYHPNNGAIVRQWNDLETTYGEEKSSQ